MNTVKYIEFPPVTAADKDGLLAMGGDLSIDTLLSAYQQGIFPWFSEGQPILWWSPDPRMVLKPEEIKVSRSLGKKIRQHRFRVTCDQNFSSVIKNCALRGQKSNANRLESNETWITQSMHDAYTNLYQQGYAHSIEAWQDDRIVGGLYGLALGDVFFGESMFSLATDASKVALATLCCWLRQNKFRVIDCQVSSEHLLSMGAKEIARSEFLESLQDINISKPFENFGKGISQLSAQSVINTL